MSKNYGMAKGYYEKGLWSKARLHALASKPLGITAKEYEEITKEAYGAAQ